MRTPILVAPYMKTDRYFFLKLQKKLLDGDGKFVPSQDVVYDFKEGGCFDLKIINKDYPSMKSVSSLFINEYMESGIKNCGVVKFEAYRLTEALSEGKLKGHLKEIASTLRDDDNPVLMLVRFKE